jgi:drug/metabolite transporter (DMT)-like permease
MALGSSRARLLLAFLTVYLVWGSSYLFMKFAVATLPPFPMAGVRYFIAGGILLLAGMAMGARRPTRAEWGAAAIVGTALMSSNGAVSWAVRRIPSGVAALLVAITPCWMVLLEWQRDRSLKPHRGTVAGLVLGLIGIALLVGPGELLGSGHIDPIGAGAVLAGTLAWTAGSLYARRAARHETAQIMSGMQMLAGGAVLFSLAAPLQDWTAFSLTAVTAKSWFGFWYLILVASLLGYTAYIYVLTNATPVQASTYAYVNPVVAVALGAWFGSEPLSPRVLIASAIIIAGVVLIVNYGTRHAAPPARSESVAAPSSARDPA